MTHIHPTMQQALKFFTGATMPFTDNPAFPHPDQDTDNVQAWPMNEAIAHAIKVLQNPQADQRARNYAATELEASWIQHEEQS